MQEKSKIEQILDIFHNINPNPRIELDYCNPFTLAIAVLLSAQTTDKIVNRCTATLFQLCTTPQEIIDMGEEELKKHISHILFANNKAKYIIKLCEILVEKYNGELPQEYQELIKLPGIGRKSASVILNSAFGQNTIGVDRHIYRIVHTIGITSGKNPDEVADNLARIVPEKYLRQVHHWLVLHGRYMCTAKKRYCEKCPIAKFCPSFDPLGSSKKITTSNK